MTGKRTINTIHVNKISKTTYFPHSNHPLLVIGLQLSNQNLKNQKKIKISTTQKQKYLYTLHVNQFTVCNNEKTLFTLWKMNSNKYN